ncbi:MAG: hypothetical protein EI684_21875 [Candidatus Viridilinea halotolerans]|uniref:Type II secretion system protein GspF domain-containing protein n=1 Tax=Candidatus Viridilinea halotolerans TaxID=2491704 RepID=A0A426TR63_9CHLR|nr:MAG: hypothetical protein EI684_21875 [Candidatus Viridilinea halotolerans]
MSVLANPGVPYYLAAFGAALLAMLGGMLLDRRAFAFAGGMRAAPTTTTLRRRVLVGNLAAIPVVATLVGVVVVGNVVGNARTMLLGAALVAYLYLGLVIPRRPLVQQQREASALRRLTPGFIAFIRVALGSFESPMDAMRRYTARPVERIALMQGAVADALQVSVEQRMRPFAALATVAHQRGCREFIDVADALAQAEQEGASVEHVLVAQQATLELILQSEFKRMLRRRTMYLLLMVAISLVVGILLNLLFVMTGSGQVLGGM